jgi:hypothetical protein
MTALHRKPPIVARAGNFRFGSIWYVRQAVGEWPVFADTVL